RHAALAKPAGSLGGLERLGAQLAAVAGTSPPPVPTDPALVIAVGDHGVHAQGVTPWPRDVTRQMVAAFCQGRTAANALAATVGARVTVLDVGVAGPVASHPLLRAARVRDGTDDLLDGPAMSCDDAARAVLAGAGVADELLAAGADLLLTGDMGIANTTPAACLVAALTGAEPEQVTGRGSGIDDATLAWKQAVVRGALERHGDDRDPLAVLASLGGLEHAALVGVVLTAAAEGVPVILDGISTVAAALVAVALNAAVADCVIAGHRSVEPGAAIALAHLDLVPLLDLQLRLGEGTGALLAVPVVRGAARLLHDVTTLAELREELP
ncbi:MAG: nicotinate-nucleotide--dimethylbenzimidazole phosphoribosyltransferase, partial [Actinomycetota bacterium]|nr:nicotinate-nucleotide--dimethylbenzimidazole phosphoribosyltransferase [Actinomycetota bacterium]